MRLFGDIEKTIERGFRKWTAQIFGPAQSDELLLLHRAMLEEIEGQVQTLARGRRVFPFARVVVTLVSPDAGRRTLLEAAFGEGGRLEADLREALDSAGCELPPSFAVEVKTSAEGDRPFAIEPHQQRLLAHPRLEVGERASLVRRLGVSKLPEDGELTVVEAPLGLMHIG